MNVNKSEIVLLRLFRCMQKSERSDLLLDSFTRLAQRCSLDPCYRHTTLEDLEVEIREQTLTARLLSSWPASWEGQEFVELENVGDPGLWLEDNLEDVIASLLFSNVTEEDGEIIELTRSYLEIISQQGYPLPSDFNDEPVYGRWTDEDERLIRQEFVRFILAWREQIVQTLENQNRSGGQELSSIKTESVV